MSVFSSDEKKIKFIDEANFKDHFLVFDGPNEGWRIQSHYLGNGMSISDFIFFINENKDSLNANKSLEHREFNKKNDYEKHLYLLEKDPLYKKAWEDSINRILNNK